MRMMLKIKVPTEIGNRAINDGSLGRILEDTVSKLKAEAAYFVAQNGMRCAMILETTPTPKECSQKLLMSRMPSLPSKTSTKEQVKASSRIWRNPR